MSNLYFGWMAQHPPTSHDGAIDLEIGPETERLVITFSMFLWGQSNVVRRLEVARIGTERFLYWEQGQPAPPPVAEVAQGKAAAQKEKNDWLNRR